MEIETVETRDHLYINQWTVNKRIRTGATRSNDGTTNNLGRESG